MDDLLREFVGESLDMIEAVAADLVAWEANPAERDGIDRIFRAVHTVKGSSGFFDLPRVTAIAHATEELLDVLRTRKRAPDSLVVVTILSAFDAIKRTIRDVALAGSEPPGDDSELLRALGQHVRSGDASPRRRASDGLDDPFANSAAGTTSAQLPVDRVTSAGDQPVPKDWRSVRVPLTLLDSLMNGVADLVLARNDMAGALRSEGIDPETVAAYERLSTLLGSVRASIGQMRMVSLRQLFGPLQRVVRQVSSELGKEVRLVSDGGEVEIDREVVEGLRDPIVHVLRNAIDHGIESPQARAAAGKPAIATVRIDGRQVGNRIVITIADDGAGIAERRLIDRAVAAGHLSADEATRIGGAAVANLIFLPGLSTASAVTDISGRGVGMDVVKANVEGLGGKVNIQSVEGEGVTIRFDVPMTMTVISALAIAAGGQEFAVPRSAVEEVMLLSSGIVQRTEVGGAPMVRVRGQLLPLVLLEDLLWDRDGRSPAGDDTALILCRVAGEVAFALEVPDVRDQAELVIKPLPPIVASNGLYNGFSLPDSGNPMLVLDVEGIARRLNIDPGRVGQAAVEQSMTSVGPANVDDGWLCFDQMGTGIMGALPMYCVSRLLDLPASDIKHVGGRLIAQMGETLVPVVEVMPEAARPGTSVRAILLTARDGGLLLPVRNILQLVHLGSDILPTHGDSAVTGITTFDGRPLEMLDPDRLFANVGVAPISAAAVAGQRRTAGGAQRKGGAGGR